MFQLLDPKVMLNVRTKKILRYYYSLAAFNKQQDFFTIRSTVSDGEELYYEVNYSFINIGWAKFNTEKVPDKPDYYTCRAKLKSNNSLPLVDVDYDFISEMSER